MDSNGFSSLKIMRKEADNLERKRKKKWGFSMYLSSSSSK